MLCPPVSPFPPVMWLELSTLTAGSDILGFHLLSLPHPSSSGHCWCYQHQSVKSCSCCWTTKNSGCRPPYAAHKDFAHFKNCGKQWPFFIERKLTPNKKGNRFPIASLLLRNYLKTMNPSAINVAIQITFTIKLNTNFD